MIVKDWLLTAAERNNPATRLDRRHRGAAWTDGNDVVALIHGGSYLPKLASYVGRMQAGDLLLFTDWRGDPDQILARGSALTVSELFCQAASRGVAVKGLIWR